MFKRNKDKPRREAAPRTHIDDIPKTITPDPGISEREGAIDYTPREKAAS
ncbi:MAG: hypothetical protein OXN95_05180 [bacterium]|nr:hypothetical protein [bacterium]